MTQFLDNGFTQVDKNKIERVRRFNDTYHNEALIGKIGITGKPFADRLMVGLTYARMYKEIQTGVRQEIVFGQKHRHGYTLMPSLEYRKRNLAANYNYNLTHQVDTSAYRYNWYGQRSTPAHAASRAIRTTSSATSTGTLRSRPATTWASTTC